MRALTKLSLLALALVAGSAYATITPVYTTFGTLPGATFGGTGIPNTPAAVTYYTDSNGAQLTIGLIATARHSTNPAPTNDGAGTYFAVNGIDAGTANDGRWNFDFFMGGADVSTFHFLLTYSVNGTEFSVDPLAYFSDTKDVSNSYQNSENLAFLPPSGFNAAAGGQYGFDLSAYSVAGVKVADAAILVDVAGPTTVPEPGTVALVGIALLAAVGATRRRFRG